MNIKYSVSILKNTNKLISSSDNKFAGISNSSMIKLEDDPTLYTVHSKESLFYIKDFKLENTKIISINEDVGVNLQKGDTIKITYKEYEAKFVLEILNGGENYNIGDEIVINGGKMVIDPKIGAPQQTKLEVSEIIGNGTIKDLKIKDGGKYLVCPDFPYNTKSKYGNGLNLNIKYLELSNRTILERTINDIYLSEGKTFLVLDYSLPLNLEDGKISVEKTILVLNQNYLLDSRKNIYYEVYTNFSPNLKIPLLVKGSLSSELVINKAILQIDEAIGKINKALNIK